MMEPITQRASSTPDFPYAAETTTYLMFSSRGAISIGTPSRDDLLTVRRYRSSTMYAMLPGEPTSTLFRIDDLDECAEKLGHKSIAARTPAHQHTISWYALLAANKPSGARSQEVDFVLTCGCELKGIRSAAALLRRRYNWQIATGKGHSIRPASDRDNGLPVHYVYVNKVSLRNSIEGKHPYALDDRSPVPLR